MKNKSLIKQDKAYLDWLSYQPSCIDGSFTQYVDGVGRNIACHVRRVGRGAGTGIKPKFSAVPMTVSQHAYQHQYGELALILESKIKPCISWKFEGGPSWEDIAWDEESAKLWFELMVAEYLIKWKRETGNEF